MNTDRAVPAEDTFDRLFDADLSRQLDSADWVDRNDWVLNDGEPAHDPVVGYTWRCPQCDESDLLHDFLESPHRNQHADGPFSTIVPLEVSELRSPS